jgi:tRNA A37 threonylcarbamoyladenosine modification protein TsaB
MVVLNAGRGHIFVQIFTKNETSKPLMVEYEDIVTLAKGYNHITITGEGVDLVEPFLQQSAINYSVLQEPKLPDAAMIALCAFDKFKNVNFINNPAPLYIKPPDAKLPAIMRPKL